MNYRTGRGFTLIEIMIVVAIIGLLAAIAMPGFRKAIETARAQACGINRKNIDGAKLRWALEKKKAADEVPSDEDLFGQNCYLDHKPGCPAGGAYSLNAVQEKCTCTVKSHVTE